MKFNHTPPHWKEVSLNELGEVNRGRSRHRPRDAAHLYGGPYPFVQTGDVKASGGRITEYTQSYSEEGLNQSRLWPAETMCITIAANIAETGILRFPACFPDSVIGFIADKNVCDIYYLEYMFRLLRRGLQYEASGSVQDNINLATLERLRFPIPPLGEQKRIVAILGALDDKIEINRAMNRTLEAMAQAIFKSWFVDFDPVKAKMAARESGADPTRAAMAAISGKDDAEIDAFEQEDTESYQRLHDTAQAFPDALVESELGLIPEGWGVRTVREVTSSIFSGGTPNTKEPAYWGGTKPWFSSGETRNRLVVTTEKTITKEGVENSSTRLACPGDILIASAGQGHTRGQTSLCQIDTYINQSVVAIRADEKKCSSSWLFQNLSNRYEEMRGLSDSHSSRGSLTTKLLAGMAVVLPTKAIVDAYSLVVDALVSEAANNEIQSAELGGIRDALLPRLLSGELTIVFNNTK